MMQEVVTTGKSVEQALEKALDELGIRADNAEVEVLDQPTHGLLGIIGNRDARVRVEVRKNVEEYFKDYMTELLFLMNIRARIDVGLDCEKLSANISGKDVGALIGRRGKTLGDLQYLMNIIMRRQFANINRMVALDVENYRERRENTLTQLARSVARSVTSDGTARALEPMNPQERRIIHLALQDYEGITTGSEGDEPHRRVVVKPLVND